MESHADRILDGSLVLIDVLTCDCCFYGASCPSQGGAVEIRPSKVYW
jgi:hypothetical protein